MNRQIVRMFGFFVILFCLLVGFTSYWAIFDAQELKSNTNNRRALIEEQTIPRGLIFADDGLVLARNRVERSDRKEKKFYRRTYPSGELFAQTVGYNFIDRGRSGLERYYNADLVGDRGEINDLFQELSGGEHEGDDLTTALDPQAQRAAFDGLASAAGAAVAIEVNTGAIKVMASVPSYDPNRVPEILGDLNKAKGSPLLDRPTQSGYPPGSSFKIVTAAAALDSGTFTPESVINGESPQDFEGFPLENFGNQSYGEVTLTEALVNSVNTAWANVGQQLGKETMFRYMRRFGMFKKPPLDFPADQMLSSGVYKGNKLLSESDPVDVARLSIGQERTRITVLQMAMVVQAIANGGKLLEPYLVEKVTDRDGRVRLRRQPREAGQAISRQSAAQLTEMMTQVVERGTGGAAQIPGVEVAGKTGTAEVDNGRSNQAWFVSFAPANAPRYAVAVTIERTQSQGGLVAAPISRQIMETLLNREQ